MKLTHLAIIAIKGSKGIVPKLAEALDVTTNSIYRYISENNDELTKAAALRVIRQETGLEDSQILEGVAA
jgi:transcriptional antiterminator